MSEQSATSDKIGRLVEAERLKREGPTLRNVAENMRTIAVLVAMFVAVGVLFRVPNIGAKALALLWGGWTLIYTLLAAFQSGLLFALALFRLPVVDGLTSRTSLLGRVVANVFAALAVAFMLAAASILTTSISTVANDK